MDQQNAELALADLKVRMNHWRTTFPRTQQLPIFLWEDAADLLPYFPIGHMAKELRQSPVKLKQKILEYHERLMAGGTKSQAEKALNKAVELFREWRSSKPCKHRPPDHLWDEIVALAPDFSARYLARVFRVNVNKLHQLVKDNKPEEERLPEQVQDKKKPPKKVQGGGQFFKTDLASIFQNVSPNEPDDKSSCKVTFARPDGAQMTIEVPEKDLEFIGGLVRQFYKEEC